MSYGFAEEEELVLDESAIWRAANDGRWPRRRKIAIGVGIFVVVLILAIALGVGLGGGGNDESASSVQGYGNPTSEVSVHDLIVSKALQGGREFFNPNSYQSKALDKLTYDLAVDSYSEQRILQVYALLCIFYSTSSVSNPATDSSLGVGNPVPNWKRTDNWLGSNECNWYGITCNGDGLVYNITLYENGLTGSFPAETVYLKDTLTYLDLFNNPVWNEGDEGNAWLGQMVNLNHLYYGATYFAYDGIPSEIGLLTNLVEYDCSYTLYTGPLQSQPWSTLNKLEYLAMGGNAYNSSVPEALAALPSLLYLYLESSSLSGDLSFMKSMPKIVEFWAENNPGLTGSIPTEIGDLSLQSWWMSDCSLTGTIPTELGKLTFMKQMWLYGNKLTGTVPSEIGKMQPLAFLEIDNNNIGGTMPTEICSLTGRFLKTLDADCSSEIVCTCCTCCSSCDKTD